MTRIPSLSSLYDELQQFPEEYARASSKVAQARANAESTRAALSYAEKQALLRIRQERGKTATVGEIDAMVELDPTVGEAADQHRKALDAKYRYEAFLDAMSHKQRSLLALAGLVRNNVRLPDGTTDAASEAFPGLDV
jgi:hypothetical protein